MVMAVVSSIFCFLFTVYFRYCALRTQILCKVPKHPIPRICPPVSTKEAMPMIKLAALLTMNTNSMPVIGHHQLTIIKTRAIMSNIHIRGHVKIITNNS